MQRSDRDLVSKASWPLNNPKIELSKKEPWKQFTKSKFEKGKFLRYGKASTSEMILQSERLPFVKDGQANPRNWGERITCETVIEGNILNELQTKAA